MNNRNTCFKCCGIAAAVTAIGLLPLQAQTGVEKPEPTSTQAMAVAAVKDYSRGFQALRKLGLPDVSKAEYVNLNVYSGGGGESQYFLQAAKLAGNAWMLEETPQVKGRFVVDYTIEREVYDHTALSREREKALEKAGTNKMAAMQRYMEADQEGGRVAGLWKKVDPKKDADKLLAFLKKSDDKSGDNPMRQLQYYPGMAGSLFLMAAHFHGKGLTNEANEIVAALFEAVGDSRKVVSEGASMLATARLKEANRVLFAAGDWAAYAATIDTLTQTYGSAWPQTPAVKRLSEKVRQQLASLKPADLTGAGLTAEDQALAVELAALRQGATMRFSMGYGQIWVIPGEISNRGRYYAPGAKPDLPARLMQRGMKSVPLLLALAKDERLVAVDRTSLGGDSYGSFSRSRSGEVDVDQLYEALPRPASRAEIASAMLSNLLPRKERQRRSKTLSPDEVAEECQRWYEANKDKSPADLARFYLQEGDSSQIQSAVRYLLKSGTPEDLAGIEKIILESEHPQEMTQVARQYVEQRGEAARGFIDKYTAKLTAGEPGEDNEQFKTEQSQKRFKQEIDSLKALTSVQPVGELLAELAAGAKSLTDVSGQLNRALAREKPDAALTLILETALKAPEAAISRDILSMAAMIRHQGERGSPESAEEGGGDAGGADAAATPGTLAVKTHAALWRKLLADKRPLGTGSAAGMTVADAAAMTMDSLYGGEADMYRGARPDGRFAMGARMHEVYRARAEAILEGRKGADLPQFPKTQALTAEEKTALGARLARLSGKPLEQAIKALTPDELVALPGIVRKQSALNAALAPMALRVRKVEGSPALAADVRSFAAAEGKVLDRATVERLLAVARRAAAAGRVVRCQVNRPAALEGVTLSIEEVTPGSREYKEMVANEQLGSSLPWVAGQIAAPECVGAAAWMAGEVNPATAATAGAATNNDAALALALGEAEAELRHDAVQAETDFWRVVGQFCSGQGNVCRSGLILFEARPVVKAAASAIADKPAETSAKPVEKVKP